MNGRVKFLPFAWAGMPKTSFRKNSDSRLFFNQEKMIGCKFEEGLASLKTLAERQDA